MLSKIIMLLNLPNIEETGNVWSTTEMDIWKHVAKP